MNNFIDLEESYDPFVLNLTTKGNMATILFRTHSGCNLNCSYCYQKKGTIKMNKNHIDKAMREISLFYKKRNLNKIIGYTKLVLIGGEVSLNNEMNKYILESIDKIDEIKEAVYLSINTNLYNVNNDFIDLILHAKTKAKKIMSVDIGTSIDFNRDIHNRYRIAMDGSKTFDNVVENISILKSHFPDLIIHAKAVITKEILTIESSSLINSIKEIKVDAFAMSMDYGIDTISDEEFKTMRGLMQFVKNDIVNSLKTKNKSKYQFDVFKLACLSYTLMYVDRTYCDVGKTLVFEAIDDNDIVIASCERYNYRSKEDNKFVIKSSSVEHQYIDNTKLFNAVKKTFECEKCNLKPFCRQLCFKQGSVNKCKEINRKIANEIKELLKEIISIDGFYKLYTDYILIFGEKFEHYSWTENKAAWEDRAVEVLNMRGLKF
ncbi:MAG: radical SAM protein [Fusobacteriaceae bacterium]